MWGGGGDNKVLTFVLQLKMMLCSTFQIQETLPILHYIISHQINCCSYERSSFNLLVLFHKNGFVDGVKQLGANIKEQLDITRQKDRPQRCPKLDSTTTS